jgi:hypothetical protein
VSPLIDRQANGKTICDQVYESRIDIASFALFHLAYSLFDRVSWAIRPMPLHVFVVQP